MAVAHARAGWGPGLRRGLVGVLLCAVASCDGCCQGDLCGWPDVEEPTLTRMEMVPADVWAAPGAGFVLGLRGWDADDNPMPVPTSGVSWTATGGLSMGGSMGGSPEVKVPTSPTQSTGQVKATVAGVTASATVHVSSLAEGDRLRVPPSTSPEPPRAVWLRVDQTACQRDLLLSVAQVAVLAELFGPGCEPTLMGILSANAGGYVEKASPSSAAVPPWTGGADVLARPTLPVPRTVSVALRYPSGGVQKTLLEEALDRAGGIFRDGMTGAVFEVVSQATIPTVAEFHLAHCNDAAVLANLGVDLTQRVIHIVYVEKIGSGLRGFTCWRGSQQAAVVVVAKKAAPNTLAHELGHAMGLYKPLPYSGEASSMSTLMYGFDVANLMFAGESTESAMPRSRISFGQAFRMNADARAWLVHQWSLAPWQCGCDAYDGSACPALYRDVTVTGTPPSPAPPCTVVPP